MDERLTWRDEYRVGIPLVDHAHRRLFELYEDLAAAHDRGRPLVARRAADELVGYVARHFTQEEGLLKALPPGPRGEHGREHDRFSRVVAALSATPAAAPLGPVVDLLGNWLVGHVSGLDRLHFRLLSGLADLPGGELT